MQTQDIVVTEPELSATKSDISELASATFSAFHPYINIYDCGKKLWDEKSQKYVPMHMITKEASVFGNRYRRVSKGQRKGYKPLFQNGKRRGRKFHYWAHYRNGIMSTEKVAEGIEEQGTYYSTSSLTRRAMPYLDIDAHHGEKDELEARRLMEVICRGFWNPSDRGQNGYLKIFYGRIDGPVLSEKFFGDLSEEQAANLRHRIRQGLQHFEINELFSRAEAVYRRYLEHHGIACKFEIKGKITEHHPKVKSGSLAKLPFKGWSWERLEEFKKVREVAWYVWERQLDLLEQMLDEAGSTCTADFEPQHLPPTTEKTSKPVEQKQPADSDSCAFTRNRHDCLPFVRSFYRQYGRTPSHQDFLDHLKLNQLFTGAWDDAESDRDDRSARVLEFVLQTFDPMKLGKGEGRWHDLPVLDWIRQYAKQNYGSLTATVIKGKNEVSFTDDGLVQSGQRFQKCKVPAAFVQHCVWVILTCVEDLAKNNGLPESRIVEVWSMLPGTAPKWNRDHYAIVRDFLEARGVVEIYDKQHWARKCWRWKKGKNYPTSPEQIEEKLDRIRSVRSVVGFSESNFFSSSKITPYCKAVMELAPMKRNQFIELRLSPFDDF